MENFSCYILKILAAYRVNYKDCYSELTFSIDPGTSQIGIIVFLDDFYLHAHTNPYESHENLCLHLCFA